MASNDEKREFLMRWYDESVKDIETFRANDPEFSGPNAKGKHGEKPIEGKPDTYPPGYTNQSLNQKAQRYLNMADHQGRKSTHKDWEPPFKGGFATDANGNPIVDSKDLFVGKILKSKNKSKGGKRGQWEKDAFKGWKPGKFTNS